MTISNLKQATALAALVSVMAIPRIIEGELGILPRLLMAFPAMTLVAGSATAWGKHGGMCGPWPERHVAARGMRVALIAGFAMAPVLLAFDFDLKTVMAAALRPHAVTLAFPETVSGCLALMLWSAGFETLFFRAGTMAFIARVTRRLWIAVLGSVLLRAFVTFMLMTPADVSTVMIVRLIGVSVLSAVACLLYARAGLPAAMLFAAVLESRHLLRLLLERGL